VPRLLLRTGASSRAMALVVTGLWLLHPLHVSGVVYVVQRMNELSALFILAGLLCYTEGRLRVLRGEPGLILSIGGLIAFGLLAVFSKENGALITAYALVIEAICFRFEAPAAHTGRLLKGFFVLAVALPCLAFLAYVVLNPEWLAHGYGKRDFTLVQRLLTEPRILFHYLLWIFVPWLGWMGLYHDDIPFSTDLLNPPTTPIAIAMLTALVILAWTQRRRSPSFSFAVAWFMVGHSMESTIIPLELVFEHRNYLPMYGLLLGAVATLDPVISRYRPTLIAGGSTLVLLLLATLTAVRANQWGDNFRLAYVTAANHPNSPRSLYDAGRMLIYEGESRGNVQTAQIQARAYFQRALLLDPLYVFPATALIHTYAGNGPVPTTAVKDLEFRLRNTRLFQLATFLSVLRAVTDGKLALTPDDIEKLVVASLDNPSTTSTMRAQILNDYGRYQFLVRHDAQQAISLTLAAVAQDPENPLFQVNISKLALALDRPDIAAEHLQKAEALDITGLYTQEISRLKAQLNGH
ncbi:MAG: hypothetical protein ACK4JF_08015, partial [Methylohalobius sp.]